MKYIKRTLERKFLHRSSFFKAVLVTGARQVGKTTMLKHLAAKQNRTYVLMDNAMVRRDLYVKYKISPMEGERGYHSQSPSARCFL